MNSKRLISAFLTLVMLLGSLVVGVDAAWADKVNEDGDPIINYLADAYTSPEDKLADMIMVKEQNGYQLWYEEFTGEVAVVDLSTGQITFSNPWDIASGYQTISDAVKEKLLSQLIITYLENDVQKTMYSYKEAALRGQITKKNIKNGIRVEYILGEEQTIRLVPRMIKMERFEELILANIDDEWQYNKLASFYTEKNANDPNLTERGVAEMQAKFPITLEMAVYVCDPEIKARELRELESIIKTFCPEYTYEELDYDHDLTNYTGDDAAPPRFRLALEYTLNDDGLEVRCPANGLSFDESAYQFQELSMLPYFGAGSNEYTGYTVIPDGSGSLIRFEDFIGKPVNLAGQMYGADYAYHEITGQHAEAMRMPYYGIVTNYDKEITPASTSTTITTNEAGEQVETVTETPAEGIFYSNGFLAIITEGDSLASLMAECGGTLHPYNTVFAKFIPRPSDEYNLADSISVSGNATWTVTSKRKYTDSYRVQYIFLKDETLAEENGLKDYYEAEWTGMATAYRDYLIAKGELTKLENVQEDMPLFIETFGSIETTERILTFPVEVDTPLTTFEDIKTMHSELTELGVGNINFKLSGYANGGLQATVPYRLKWTKVVGGDDGFTDLAKYAAENGFNIYPDFDFVYIRAQELFDGVSLKKHAVRTIDDRYTTRRAYDAATQSFDRSFAIAISPSVYEYLYDAFGPRYLSYGNDSISVSTLGTDLNSDFDEDEPYHREDGKQFTIELLERLDSDYENIMIEGGNAYAVKYADVILNASLTSSKYVKASESIPFLGMVYHGSKVFTGSATNMEGDINEAILRSIENGASLYFILSYQNTSELKESNQLSKYYSVSYDIWKDDVAKYYSILNDAISDLQTSYIVDHEFLDGERIPDADEIEADRLAEEEAAAAEAEKEAQKLLDAERAARLEARLAKQNGEEVEEEVEEPAEEAASEEVAEPTEDTETEEGANVNEFGEEEIVEEEEEKIVPDKYKTVSGSIVRVEYEGGVNFILNYNSYAITVEYDGQTYEIDSLSFVRID
ncbi:MAG: DUF5696 domain-containing protein [Eubacteriales bacterium]